MKKNLKRKEKAYQSYLNTASQIICVYFIVALILVLILANILLPTILSAQPVFNPIFVPRGFPTFSMLPQSPLPSPYSANFLAQSPSIYYGPYGPAGFIPYPPSPWKIPGYSTIPLLPYSAQSYSIQPQFFINRSITLPPTSSIWPPYQPSIPLNYRYSYANNPFGYFNNLFSYPTTQYSGNVYPNLALNLQPNQFNTTLPQPEGTEAYPIPEDIPEARKTALKKALDWIFKNPTQIEENPIEVGEEIILFYQLYRRAGTQAGKNFCQEYISDRIKQLIDSGRLNNPSFGEISVYLPVCDIMVKLGLSLFDHIAFINQKVLPNPNIFSSAHEIWNTSILERLGFHVPTPLIYLIQQGAVGSELRSSQLMQLMDMPNSDFTFILNTFYDIIHEIIPLTSFGDTPISILDYQQISFLQNLIIKGIAYFLENSDLDIICELLVCANMLGINNTELLEAAYQFIINNQITDGSFGESLRLLLMGRKNAYRHIVFVAVWALIQ